MKKYGICLLSVIVTGVICFFAGYWATRQSIRVEPAVPNTTYGTETMTENRQVMNQEEVEPVIEMEKHYLVPETGFPPVLREDKGTIRLYTHVPIINFPEKKRDGLRKGTWFTSMMDIYNYLESYTS